MEDRFKKIGNNSFCILPWIHLYIEPSGNVFTCCLKDSCSEPLGNINRDQVTEIWNSKNIQEIRKNFLNGNQIKNCQHCYDQEQSGEISHRQIYNDRFSHLISKKMDLTTNEGEVKELSFEYWDFRFSNTCNLKCRTCNPTYSSSWLEDYNQIHPNEKIERIENKKEKFNQLLSHLEYVEEIYFAGGEPLITAEHYIILNKLIELKKFNVKLNYNTNLTSLNFQGQNVLELWKHFNRIIISPSIDHFGNKASYIRSGTDWDIVVGNINSIKQALPNIILHPTITVSVFNALDIAEILIELDRINLISFSHFNNNLTFNVLRTPEYYNIGAMGEQTKNLVRYKLGQFKQYLIEKYGLQISQLVLIEDALNSNLKNQMNEFSNITNKLDQIRNENFSQNLGQSIKELFT